MIWHFRSVNPSLSDLCLSHYFARSLAHCLLLLYSVILFAWLCGDVCVCVCVCVCVSEREIVCGDVYVCVSERQRERVCHNVCVCVCARAHVCMILLLELLLQNLPKTVVHAPLVLVRAHVHMRVCIRACVRTCTWECVHIRVCVCTCVYVLQRAWHRLLCEQLKMLVSSLNKLSMHELELRSTIHEAKDF